ncbi:hypothetical protein [Brevibacillus centrosporus]|jgi:hypothetical protein|uniref:hypothetical protein n=1 Tax=Brevibacillus centrosporus TaxID=54910 RepID=UPI003985FF90
MRIKNNPHGLGLTPFRRTGISPFFKQVRAGWAVGVEKPVSILRSRLRPTGGGCWPLRHASEGIAKVAPLRSESRVAILLPRVGLHSRSAWKQSSPAS